MTFETVQRAAWDLRVQGRTPSGNALLQYFKSRGQPGSKRTILKYLKQGAADPPARPDDAYPVATPPPLPRPRVVLPVAGDPAPGAAPLPVREPDPAPVPIQEPPPVSPALNGHAVVVADDPVAKAEQAVLGAEFDLAAARDNMQTAALAAFVAGGVVIDSVRYGALDPQDDAKHVLVDAARETNAAYRLAWGRLVQARQAVKAAHETARRQRQAQWVEAHAPALCADLQAATQALAAAATDRQRYIAKTRYSQVLFDYQSTLLRAPVD